MGKKQKKQNNVERNKLTKESIKTQKDIKKEKSEVFGLGESELKKWNVWIKIIKYVIRKMTIFLKTFFLNEMMLF